MVTVITQIRGQQTSTVSYKVTDSRVALEDTIRREDPFQDVTAIEADSFADYVATYEECPNRPAGVECDCSGCRSVISPTLELGLDGPYNRNDHMVQWESDNYTFE